MNINKSKGMKDLDLRLLSIKDTQDVAKFIRAIEYGLPKVTAVLKRVEASNVALRSVNQSIMKKNQMLESGQKVSDALQDKGESGLVESVEEVSDTPAQTSGYDAPLQISQEEALAAMREARASLVELTQEEMDGAEEVEVIEDEEVSLEEDFVEKEEVEVLDEETVAAIEEVADEEPLDEEPLNEEPVKEVSMQWPRVSRQFLFDGLADIQSKTPGVEKLFNKDGKWYGLVDADGNGVYFAIATFSMMYLAPDKSRFKAIDAPAKLKELGEENKEFLIELAFTAFKTPKTFSFDRIKKHLSDEYLEKVFEREDSKYEG